MYISPQTASVDIHAYWGLVVVNDDAMAAPNPLYRPQGPLSSTSRERLDSYRYLISIRVR